ncbi:hypothetical protein HEQ62_10270 [Haematospirillum jordaniae]|uniref:Phage tail protein n=1 Tax=Haematospirillum jordaniae TaxID=1549855 RepID=A0A143DG00_9PROT|nr:phage tail protein [Haematospirillum jordaniae]AMW35704.1 hypothetical protein AY555_09985 [Haematospirillum jordaniae]NKD46012.1 hypothetical protein [Haematospirillum jordaniae]NKD60155.1 hypothetical protein [Haematospirillum jordaniae]NKD68031.1 hypothetical protein [Haematospirillum jordaniae]NKD82204.1 hypothetical protein [Haematospirillum jordaniae]
MKKLGDIREAVLGSPLGIAPDKLLVFAEKGSVLSRRGPRNHAFVMNYTAHLIVTDYTGAPEALFFVVLDWLHTVDPDVSDEAIRFLVDVIDHKSVDISLTIDLEDIVAPSPEAGGVRLRIVSAPDVMKLGEVCP